VAPSDDCAEGTEGYGFRIQCVRVEDYFWASFL
jgi:hypothetical protein